MARYKLLVLDLDGTLLNSALRLSDTNAAAVRRVMDAGMLVVFATARWYQLAKRTADRLGLVTHLICSNGALVKHSQDGRELLHLTLDEEAAREIVTAADDSGWEMFTTIGDTTYMKMRPGVIAEKLPAGLRVSERQSEHLGEGAPTCVQLFGDEVVAAVEQRFVPKYDGRVGFSINRPSGTPHYALITHPAADKAKALELVCADLGVAPLEAVVMGDSESDLGMLRMAGLGIAMSNSPDEVKRVALHIAPANDEDGVAWAIERFVL